MKELKEFTVERLEYMIKSISGGTLKNSPSLSEIVALAKIALEAKQAEPVGEVRLSDYDSDGWRQGQVICLHDQADWDNFPDGTKLYTTPPLNHTEHNLDMVKLLRNLVDAVWSEAKESDEVPSTKWADEMIAKVYPVAASKPEM